MIIYWHWITIYYKRLTMCGYFGTVLTVLYPEGVVDELVDFLIGLFDLPDDVKVFCLQQFLPEMRTALNVSEISFNIKIISIST